MTNGETPSVLALSFGAGDPQRDSVMGVFLDAEGHLREHLKVDTLTKSPEDRGYDPAHREAFVELIRRRRPQVIVIGGFSAATKNLMTAVQEISAEVSKNIVTDGDDELEDDVLTDEERMARARFECIYVHDDVARIYQNSKRATGEFPDLATLGKYCVGLARYAQSPLNEYAALGEDITAINYHPGQKYVRFCFFSRLDLLC